jgi:hypothetical protein
LIEHQETGDFELIYPPDKPFYPTPAPWNPIYGKMFSIPLFYLTDTFTREQQRALEAEIQTPTGSYLDRYGKVCCFVPWTKGPEDGNIASMWEVLWEMRSYDATNDYCKLPYFFIDRQSAIDGTVIVMELDRYFGTEGDENAQKILRDVVEPEIRGFNYGRIKGRDAHTAHTKMGIANVGIWDLFKEREDEVMNAPRPGWPGHGILRDSAEDWEDSEDSE